MQLEADHYVCLMRASNPEGVTESSEYWRHSVQIDLCSEGYINKMYGDLGAAPSYFITAKGQQALTMYEVMLKPPEDITERKEKRTTALIWGGVVVVCLIAAIVGLN